MTTDAPMRVRRGSAYPDYLAVQIESLQLDDEEELSSSSSSALSRGVFHAKDDASLHALPRSLYRDPQRVTAIKVSHCPLRYLGTKAPKDGEEELRIERSLSISPLYNLREVIVVNAKLKSLPAGFGSMPFLTIINVARNVISTLPPDIADGPKIHTLDVSCNLLSGELPEGILDSKSLKVLRLENNDLRAEHFPEQDDLEGARLQLRTLSVDEAVMKGLPEGAKPYPVKSERHLEVLLEKNHIPTLKRQQQSSSFQMIPPKGDEARDVTFSPHALVGYRWETTTEEDGYVYTDEFKVSPLEIVVNSADHLYQLWQASSEDANGNKLGPITKVSQVFIDGDIEAERMLPLLSLAPAVRTVVCTNCKIKELPEDFFSGKHSLRYVDFRGNNIREIPPSFSETTSLRVALFDDNFILNFPVIPTNLVYLSLNGNCLCMDNDPTNPTNRILGDHFAKARALKRFEMKDNPTLVSEFLPGERVPTHLLLNTLVMDRKAVLSKEKKDWPIPMADGKVPTFVEIADPKRLERVKDQRFFRKFGQGDLGAQRFADRFIPYMAEEA